MKNLKFSAALFFLFVFVSCQKTSIEVNMASELNSSADQVGIWVNTTSDKINQNFVDGLRLLNIKMLRYGWQYGIFDAQNTNHQLHSPCDPGCQGNLTKDGCMFNENFGPDGVAALCDSLNCDAFAVNAMDGMLYSGDADEKINNMSREERSDFYVGKAAEWARWSFTNNKHFKYFELGNENDLKNPMYKSGVGGRWDPKEYAVEAKKMAIAIKNVSPDFQCGINGSLLPADTTAMWFDAVYRTVPDMNDYIDFIVYHRYEFWVDYENWKKNAREKFGHLANGMTDLYPKYFKNLPIYVTEIGCWRDDADKLKHYRALLNCEMFGNIFTHPYIKMAMHWPTTWADGVFYANDSYGITPMGRGLLAYTKFAQPIMVDNNHINNVRYFVAKNPENQKVTVWLINHNTTKCDFSIKLNNFAGTANNEQWRLTSPNNDPNALENDLWQDKPAKAKVADGVCRFNTTLLPTSLTIIHFTGQE